MAEIRNLPVAEAQARLDMELAPRSERASGIRGDAFEATTASLRGSKTRCA